VLLSMEDSSAGVGRLGGAMQRHFRQLPVVQLGCNG
jgi:hypothetical protein